MTLKLNRDLCSVFLLVAVRSLDDTYSHTSRSTVHVLSYVENLEARLLLYRGCVKVYNVTGLV